MRQFIVDIKHQNETFLKQQTTILKKLDENSADIVAIKSENVALKSRVSVLEEKFVHLDQYSRKDVVILTGLDFTEGEQHRELEYKVINLVNEVTNQNFTMKDFIAIHRNGNKHKASGRPPSVTLKFIRYFDKDLLFTKNVIARRKELFRNVNFHHCLSQGMIDIQNKISAHNVVKFVKYMGAGKFFNVCCKSPNGDDFFINRVQNSEHFITELNKVSE